MNLPNKLTILRICFVPVFILCFYIELPYMNYIAAGVFTIAFLTDIADGYIARKYGLVTNFGKFMDPIADKLLVLSAFIMLCEAGKMPAIAVIIATLRELVISGIRLIVSGEGKVIAASVWGKVKTVLQTTTVVVILLENVVVRLIGFSVSPVFIWGSTLAAVWSCVDYIIKNAKYIDFRT